MREHRIERSRGAAALAALAVALLVLSENGSAAEPAVATDTPAATVDSLHRGLVALSHERPSADLAERYRVLEPLIEATHDLPYIAQFALRRQWPSLTEADRARFVAAFTRLSVQTYASRFKNVTAATFKNDGASAADSGRAQVQTAIVRPGEADIPLEYLLQQEDGAWRIINIIADGVSDLALKRAEYQRVLASGTIDDLIKHVDEQTLRLEGK